MSTEPTTTGHEEDVALASAVQTPPQASASALHFRDIYEQYFEFVYRSVCRMGVQEKAWDDACQDVFLVVHRRLGDFEGRSSIKTWLYGITRRVAKDYRRRVSRKEQGMVTDEGLVSSSQSPVEDAARRQAAAIFQSILHSLDEAKREVFILAEVEQMTVPEIADSLELNLNTTYSRLRAARQEFEKAVARHHAKEEGLR